MRFVVCMRCCSCTHRHINTQNKSLQGEHVPGIHLLDGCVGLDANLSDGSVVVEAGERGEVLCVTVTSLVNLSLGEGASSSL